MSGPNSAVIFAAGFGTRMGALTKNIPKPLIKVAGKPLIDYALDLANEVVMGPKIVNTHYLAEQLDGHLTQRPGVQTLHEENKILETGGGLKNALPMLDGNVVYTLNSDAVWTGPNPLLTLLCAWQPEHMDGLLILIDRQDALEHRGSGDFFMLGTGALKRRKQEEHAPFVYGGIQIIKTDGLAEIEQDVFSLNLLWDRMLEQGRLYGAVHPGGWVDVGRPEGIAVAEALLQSSDV